MNVDHDKVARLLDGLIRRTDLGLLDWSEDRRSNMTTYITAFAHGSVLLEKEGFLRTSLRILDEDGQEVFQHETGPLASSRVIGNSIIAGANLDSLVERLAEVVRSHATSTDRVLDDLLSEIES